MEYLAMKPKKNLKRNQFDLQLQILLMRLQNLILKTNLNFIKKLNLEQEASINKTFNF